ncbi:hypothetical protein M9H77_31729 [Catharanthus roseus]|uniref:Uncharacterized protein n=1 Tax=Catharanthus roseus TaxID=4058 RepID=A0ACC0A3L4_CATRO|nr:hypothetical protein M9H77_31729 [Catharanthus roseus]
MGYFPFFFLIHSDVKFDLSCNDIGTLDDTSLVYPKVYLRKIIENVGDISSFLDTFMENHNEFIFLNQLMPFLSGQVEFSCNELELSNVIDSLKMSIGVSDLGYVAPISPYRKAKTTSVAKGGVATVVIRETQQSCNLEQ